MASQDQWENIEQFRMTREEADKVIAEAPGCTVCWTRKDGQPLGVWMSHAVFDGHVWVTTTENRPKTKAWRRDPRASAVFGIGGKAAVTLVGRVEISDDPKLRMRFLTALADKMGLTDPELRRQWYVHLDSPGRVIVKIVPEKYITFDERKLVW